ncbi:PilC/PilY family type IV pilus protein [Pseudomonas sp. F1_0610]|uniref:pilus assembly protein n=1 Tax=Pseudomonas sp. F1_0610 TaxID=3114284 RepID=UPI0039C34ECB
MKINHLAIKKLVVMIALASGSLHTYAKPAQQSIYEPSQQPLMLRESVAPNVIFTLDTSGSMSAKYVPDGLSPRGSKILKFVEHNPLAYDPNPQVTYDIPWYAEKEGKDETATYRFYQYNNFYEYDKRNNLKIKTDGFRSNTTSIVYDDDLSYAVKIPNCNSKNDTDEKCYKLVMIDKNNPDEVKKYATWYAFYRNRMLLTKSAANLAFMNLPPETRVTWQELSGCTLETSCGGTRVDNFLKFTAEHKYNFYTWLNDTYAHTGTPLHRSMERAGKFFSKDLAYKERQTEFTCRNNYHVMMTDGEYTDGISSSINKVKLEGITNRTFSLPDGTTYTGQSPFGGVDPKNRNSLAYTALYYWATDLYKGEDNVVPFYQDGTDYWNPKNDPATWQHMTNFIVGLGLTKGLDPKGYSNPPIWDPSKARPTYENIVGKTWPDNKIFSLWHAAIVSRGEFYSADKAQEITQAFQRIVSRIAMKTTSTTAPTTVSSVIEGDEAHGFSFETSFSSVNGWSGNLRAFKVTNGSREALWGGQGVSEKLKTISPNQRKIMIQNPVTRKGVVDFTWSNLPEDYKAYLNISPDIFDPNLQKDGLGEKRVNFIRGDQTYADGKIFAAREHLLGDILNSKPVAVKDARYLIRSITWSAAEQAEYRAFYEEKKKRPRYIYVGANDGMLHAINAETGIETFAYIPKAVIPYLNELTSVNYGEKKHRYYVDGQLTVADVYSSNGWRTILVGTLGAGGKGIFALDITNPTKIELLWDLDSVDFATTTGRLGYTYSVPSVVRFNDGKWKVVFGNGPASIDVASIKGYASLFVLDAETGKLEREYLAHRKNDNEISENGLSTPKIVSLQGNGIADVAYAGDLQGNLWRFDLTTDPKKTHNHTPLFRAISKEDRKNVGQSITTAPLVVRHPTQPGYIVIFGTGRYIADADKSPDMVQDIYGIWDPLTKAKGTYPGRIYPKDLAEQEVIQNSPQNNKEAITITQNPVNWARWHNNRYYTSSKEKHKGWRITLNKTDREMVVYNPISVGKAIVVQTLLPDSNSCASGLESRLYAFDPATGSALKYPIFVNSPEKVNGLYVSGTRHDGTGGLNLSMSEKGPVVCSAEACFDLNLGESGRQTWRKVE